MATDDNHLTVRKIGHRIHVLTDTSVHTSNQVHEYKVPNKQGEPAVTAIRQAIAAR